MYKECDELSVERVNCVMTLSVKDWRVVGSKGVYRVLMTSSWTRRMCSMGVEEAQGVDKRMVEGRSQQ